MSAPLTQQDVISAIEEYRLWSHFSGATPSPRFFTPAGVLDPSIRRIAGTLFVHGTLHLVSRLAVAWSLHRVAEAVARARILTDHISAEPMQCGLNAAYCNLGLAQLAQGKVQLAVASLDNAWRVYPCPHNSSFGLRMKLCKRLRSYPGAVDVVQRYEALNRAFLERDRPLRLPDEGAHTVLVLSRPKEGPRDGA